MRDRDIGKERDRENKVVCKTLPINYKIPAAPPPRPTAFLLHLHAPPQSNYKIVEAMSYSNSNSDSLFDCIRRHSWAQKLASYEVVSLSLSKSKSETDLQLPLLLVVVSVALGLRLHCRIRCNWKGAAGQATGAGKRGRKQEAGAGVKGIAAAVSRALELQLKTFA